uniref:Uncharacterized protein n=1 Tax=Cucumis melo TaxID=3656 RepID=A0A9I9D206_CUCME
MAEGGLARRSMGSKKHGATPSRLDSTISDGTTQNSRSSIDGREDLNVDGDWRDTLVVVQCQRRVVGLVVAST